MSDSEIEIQVQGRKKCSHLGCDAEATWKGTSTKESISKINDEYINKIKHLLKAGTWFYCNKHKDIIEASSPHLQFEAI